MDHKTETTLLFSFLFFITYLITIVSAKDLCNKNDKNTLLKIKKSLNNPYHLASWDSKSDCCSWYSLECGDATVNYRVISLTIFSGQISGQIPPEVGDLPYLQNLMFHKITNITGQIPSTITKLKYLRSLRLSWLNLTGPVPEFLSHLMNLDNLDLSFNQLSGSLPSSLSLLPKLSYVDLSRNKLTGTIPESFGSFLAEPPYLLLSHNQLSGSIPKSLGNIDFNHIDFSRNKLTGDASMLFGAKKTTFSIDLSRNMFQFDLSRVELHESFAVLDLNHNKITGSIPVQWTKNSLQILNVSYNRLCGRIPTGGSLQRFGSYTYFHNKCLCGAPLDSCK
ncbi:Polygalacturonase inhibitor 1 [Raphanus sativus]|uniref:Polygalacturonase inhibitor 1 n=1 Tax=Raphanus sativus TaxID=3726 RepID=A0A6J0K2K6_RAPSA|nr:polygalacturonase inhibitor 1 [Raphanus sativus]KAJ4883319.1 Polygalacturonase inhibitor 1 [Raphanus sativus]